MRKESDFVMIYDRRGVIVTLLIDKYRVSSEVATEFTDKVFVEIEKQIPEYAGHRSNVYWAEEIYNRIKEDETS